MATPIGFAHDANMGREMVILLLLLIRMLKKSLKFDIVRARHDILVISQEVFAFETVMDRVGRMILKIRT
jgi:hypothetical protein